jgi:hypothetical protein
MITGIMNFYRIILGLKLMSNMIHTPLGPLTTWVHIHRKYIIHAGRYTRGEYQDASEVNYHY